MTDQTVERQQELWEAFVDSYSATRTRPAVDMFLRAIIGRPKPGPSRP